MAKIYKKMETIYHKFAKNQYNFALPNISYDKIAVNDSHAESIDCAL